MQKNVIERAQGCLLGQLSGDSLGSLVEFMSAKEIRRLYPDGILDMDDGGAWNTIAGQPTDDSEMAITLARALVKTKRYTSRQALAQYTMWMNSRPFDMGITTQSGLTGYHDHDSQSNGALMRISPLGIFGTNHELIDVAKWAQQDAKLTHPNVLCQHINILFACGITTAIRSEHDPQELVEKMHMWAKRTGMVKDVVKTIEDATKGPPKDYITLKGWVRIAFQNAMWYLWTGAEVEEGIIDTAMRGGDTDTNAAICGALLGAVYGRDSVPDRWVDTIKNCRPQKGLPGVYKPRPKTFWPCDALLLARQLVTL